MLRETCVIVTECSTPTIAPTTKCFPRYRSQEFTCTETNGHPDPPRYAMYYEHDAGAVNSVNGRHYQHTADTLGDFSLRCTVSYSPQSCPDCNISCSTDYDGIVYGESDISPEII